MAAQDVLRLDPQEIRPPLRRRGFRKKGRGQSREPPLHFTPPTSPKSARTLYHCQLAR